jgi:phosphatidylserine/phosphatidylglycerophosphate/cardiolipin synthase-like enzyme
MQSTMNHRFHTLRAVLPVALTLVIGLAGATSALARGAGATYILLEQLEQPLEPGSSRLPSTGEVEFAFSPKQGAERLVIEVIASARQELRVLAYSFTSAPVTAALIAARRRGVDVAVLVDQRSNLAEDRSGKAKAALGALALAGVRVRTIAAYPIHHDKVMVADRVTVQTGSFNYSAAAANSNSENVLVLWNQPQVAQGYLAHWERNWRRGTDWQPTY